MWFWLSFQVYSRIPVQTLVGLEDPTTQASVLGGSFPDEEHWAVGRGHASVPSKQQLKMTLRHRRILWAREAARQEQILQ